MKKYISEIILLVIAIITISQTVYAQDENYNIKAKVIKDNGIEEVKQDESVTKEVQKVIIRVLEGEYENEEYEMTYVISEDIESINANIELKKGDNILVNLEEKEGEVTNITYKETINQNYVLYVVGVILIIILLLIGIKIGIASIILYIITIIVVSLIIIFSMKMGWNLILVSSTLSFVITLIYIIRANGMNMKTLSIILGSVISIAFAGILMNILFDVMGLTNINIKITENFVNIKELICSSIIIVSCGLCNLIMLVKLKMDSFMSRPYKTKSDNIIEGQRSLKL